DACRTLGVLVRGVADACAASKTAAAISRRQGHLAHAVGPGVLHGVPPTTSTSRSGTGRPVSFSSTASPEVNGVAMRLALAWRGRGDPANAGSPLARDGSSTFHRNVAVIGDGRASCGQVTSNSSPFTGASNGPSTAPLGPTTTSNESFAEQGLRYTGTARGSLT